MYIILFKYVYVRLYLIFFRNNTEEKKINKSNCNPSVIIAFEEFSSANVLLKLIILEGVCRYEVT